MKALSKTLVIVVFSAVVVGISLTYLFGWLRPDIEPTSSEYPFLWGKVLIATISFFSFLFGFVEPRLPWRWPLIIAYVHYFSGFFILKHWGQIPPLELLYISVERVRL